MNATSTLAPDVPPAITTAHLTLIVILAIAAMLVIWWGSRRRRAERRAREIEESRQDRAGYRPSEQPTPRTSTAEPSRAPVETAPPAQTTPPVTPPPPPVAAEPEPQASPAPAVAPAPAPAESGDAAAPVTMLKGLGPKVSARLAEQGITTVGQLAALTPAEAEALDAELGTFRGRMTRDRWIEQAKLLAAGNRAEYEATFGKLG